MTLRCVPTPMHEGRICVRGAELACHSNTRLTAVPIGARRLLKGIAECIARAVSQETDPGRREQRLASATGPALGRVARVSKANVPAVRLTKSLKLSGG
jgi:hypothetical protein